MTLYGTSDAQPVANHELTFDVLFVTGARCRYLALASFVYLRQYIGTKPHKNLVVRAIEPIEMGGPEIVVPSIDMTDLHVDIDPLADRSHELGRATLGLSATLDLDTVLTLEGDDSRGKDIRRALRHPPNTRRDLQVVQVVAQIIFIK